MIDLQQLKNDLERIEEILGYSFVQKERLLQAFVHRSYYNEHKQEFSGPNERLEFLGDAILGFLVSDFLFQQLPHLPEGELSVFKSALVDGEACASYVERLNLQGYVLLGKGERMNERRSKESIQADLFEALIGALYLDGGLEAVKMLIDSKFKEVFIAKIEQPIVNAKARLQDYCQRHYQKLPEYRVLDQTGPEHAKIFNVGVYLEGELLGQGQGSSKKQGEQKAAQHALEKRGLHES